MKSEPEGYYYNTVENNGFVARVVKVGSTYTVVFRGTDLSGSLSEFISNNLGYLEPELQGLLDSNKVDTGDFDSNYRLGFGTWSGSQLDDALALVQAVRDQAAIDGDDVVLTGQSLGGRLAGLVGVMTGLEAHVFAPAPFENQLNIEAQKAAVEATQASYGS